MASHSRRPSPRLFHTRTGWLCVSAITLGATITACDPPARRRDAGPLGDTMRPSGGADEDRDGIPDEFEGRTANRDTDADGTPDYLDADSDGDGIFDLYESGNPGGAPSDSDSDGMADFIDLDSDGNGIPDASEGMNDTDGDGRNDVSDLDDDGDIARDVIEIGPNASSPRDTDGDGAPDFRDTDSDGDTILDALEGESTDTNRDMIVDRIDRDSDGDTIPDSVEAGDADPSTLPVDTDGDGDFDFRDADSDADGLSDAAEAAATTSPTNADSDGDGVSDLVEVSSGTNPLDGADSPRTRGDFVFLEPFMRLAVPRRDTLDFATNIRQADVYFLMDTTGSMGGSVASLRASLAAFIPEVRAAIPDVWIGSGHFKDYPVSPYGSGGDFAYGNCGNVTADSAAAVGALGCFSVSGGNDGPESHTAALWAVATGSGLPGNSASRAAASCPAGTFGYPCFRSTAVPIVVLISDITAHNGPGGTEAYNDGAIGGHAPTYPEAIAALNARNIRVIGIGQGAGGAGDLQSFARDTGSVDAGGAPLYSTWSGGTIGATVLAQIETLAAQTRLDISIRYTDDASDAVDSFASFVDHIEANTAGDMTRGCVARAAEDTNADGYLDTFRGVTAGQRVCFDIVVKDNTTVMPTLVPQLFRGTINVIGDGFTPLDERDVFFLVPPTIRDPGDPI